MTAWMLQLVHANEELKGLWLCFQGTFINDYTLNLVRSYLAFHLKMQRHQGEAVHASWGSTERKHLLSEVIN